jgi:hypothetical protein
MERQFTPSPGLPNGSNLNDEGFANEVRFTLISNGKNVSMQNDDELIT